MGRPLVGAGIACMALCAVAFRADAAPSEKRNTVEDYTFRSFDGRTIAAKLGYLTVPENRTRPTASVKLAYVRLPATTDKPKDPIVFLAGGPGIPGIAFAQVPAFTTLFDRLRNVSDVILLDQRGTGLSSPRLDCPAVPWPANTFQNEKTLIAALAEFARSCGAHWRQKGVDVGAYNSRESAADLEDLRQVLGARKLNLFGWSYGTELALAAIRRNSEQIDQVVLAETRGPDGVLKAPKEWDDLLQMISVQEAHARQYRTSLVTALKTVSERLRRKPLSLTVKDQRLGADVPLQVGDVGLHLLIRPMFTDTRRFAALSDLVRSLEKGDTAPFRTAVEQMYNGFTPAAMGLATDCAAGWSPARRRLVERQSKQAILKYVNLQWNSKVCAALGAVDLGPGFRAPIRGRNRVLFISGTLDPSAQPKATAAIRTGFPNSQHLIVENGGHETISAPPVQAAILNFFKTGSVSATTVKLPPPTYNSPAQPNAPPTPPR